MTTLTALYRRKKRRWLQRLLGVHAIHHPRYSFGLTVPFTQWVYFLEHQVKDHNHEPVLMRTVPGHWKRCPKDSYHNCTITGVY